MVTLDTAVNKDEGIGEIIRLTYRIYIMTPKDHMSHDLSYFSGPRTSGAADTNEEEKERERT